MSVAAARSILRSTASRAASSPARLSGAAKASRSPFRISNQNSLAHRIFRYLSHSHTNTESVVDACGDELLCQIFVAISHSNGFCIAHFNALRLSRLDPRRDRLD